MMKTKLSRLENKMKEKLDITLKPVFLGFQVCFIHDDVVVGEFVFFFLLRFSCNLYLFNIYSFWVSSRLKLLILYLF